MKVLHIGFTDYGGAGKGMLYLHRALKEAGVDSHILVAEKFSPSDDITCAERNLNLYSYSKNKYFRFFQKTVRKRGWGLHLIDKYRRRIGKIPASETCFFTFPITNYDISGHPLVKEADIIHLHWIANFVDFPSFFRNINKSIVWTLRDLNPGMGGFHYKGDVSKHGDYYASIEKDFLEIKRNGLSACHDLTLVAMTDEMMSFCANNDLLRTFPVKRIDGLINFSQYDSLPQSLAKKALGLDESVFSVLFVAVNLGDPNKGLKTVFEALGLLPFAALLICVGRNNYFDSIPDRVIFLNTVDSERLMSVIYSAADVFVSPSTQESFGKTTIEALSCGTPIISSETGIAPEVITPDNGILLDEISVEAVAQAIIKVHGIEYDRESIRKQTLDRFAPGKIVKQYIDLYEELIS